MNEQSAFLTCRCGACRITLCDPNVRFRTECLCCDCRQRGLISASKRAGNGLPDQVENYDRGVDDLYFANALLVNQASHELLTFSRLREDAFNTTCMSTCCATLMCGTHPVYEGVSISVNADSCRVTVPVMIPVQAILFGCDFPADKYSMVQSRAEAPSLFSVYDQLDHRAMTAMISALTKPLKEQYKAEGFTTFEALCADKVVEIDNSFYAESRQGKPQA